MEDKKADFRKQIESHSSALTNNLVFEIKGAVWKGGLEAMSSKPDAIRNLSFFAAVAEYYLETAGAHEADDLEKIEEQISLGNKIASKIRVTGSASPGEIENLLQHSIRVQHMINHSLQKKRYFFRMGESQPKGIEGALAIFGPDAWKKDGETEQVQDQA